MELLFTMAGGLALFLYGMELAGRGLKTVAGAKLRGTMRLATKNWFSAVVVGAFLAVALNSSSAASVMIISFAEAGFMALGQTLGLLLGTGIGTAVTVQIFTFKVAHYSLLFIAAGFLFYAVSKAETRKALGLVVMGVGLVFFGIALMKSSVSGLKDPEYVRELAGPLLSKPLAIFLASTIFTGVIQGSAATVIMVQGLASQGLLGFDGAVAAVLGANIGTCVTGILASLRTGATGKQVALSNILFRVISALLLLPFIGPVSRLFQPAGGVLENAARPIANVHLAYNVYTTLIFLPFLGLYARVMHRIVRRRPKVNRELPADAGDAARALELAHTELVRMGGNVREMFERAAQLYDTSRLGRVQAIEEMDESVDFADESLAAFLTRLRDVPLTLEEEDFRRKLLYLARDLETIGDYVAKDACKLARKRLELDVQFTIRGLVELREFHARVGRGLQVVLDVLALKPGASIRPVLEFEAKIDERKRRLLNAHWERMSRKVPEAIASSTIFIDALVLLRNVHVLIADMAQVMEWQRKGPPSLKDTIRMSRMKPGPEAGDAAG